MKFTQHGRAFDIEGADQRDHIVACITLTGAFYESDLLDYIRFVAATRDPGVVAIDVGANIGNHSIYLANFVAREVLAIEPNPGVLPALHRNVRGNSGHITVLECAVGRERGSGQMDMASATGNSGMARVRQAGPPGAEPVVIETLDAIVHRFIDDAGGSRRVGVIKVDVEGMELDVLAGADTTLDAHHPDLFIEAHDAQALAPIAAFLGGRGYARMSRWAATPVYHFAFRHSLLLRLRVAQYVAVTRLRRWIARWLRRAPRMPSQ